jgi:glycine/D-amino acid oxidase-like deaminating enzyme
MRNGVAVVTSQGRRDGCELVLALGAWSPPLAKSLGLRLPIQPARATRSPIRGRRWRRRARWC